jgi:CRP/FNR family cyclic AMP-dependent transcriptional regulator
MDATVRTLSEFSLFASLGGHALARIAPLIRVRTYEPDHIIVFAGEPCEGIYLVVQGMVSVRRLSAEGREYVLDYLGVGELFGLVPMFDGGQSLATMEALAHTTVYFISHDQFLDIVQEHQAVSRAALAQLATRVRYLSDTVVDLALHTVRTRLARFLLSRVNGDGPYAARWTQEEIASHIGTVRDVVGRTLRIFAREGMIRRERGRLVVADRGRLEQEALRE